MAQDQVLDKVAPGDEISAKGYTFDSVTAQIANVVMKGKAPLFWYATFAVGFGLLLMFLFAVVVLFAKGVGIWGIRSPVMWGFAITNFVWWIGIGHADRK